MVGLKGDAVALCVYRASD